MDLIGSLEKFNKKIKIFFNNLNYKQKLLLAIIFLLIMIFLVKVVFGNIVDNRNAVVDYSNTTGEDIYILSSELEDNNLYVILKNIADDIISECLEQKIDNNGKYITIERMYKEILTSNYKKNISKKEFISIAKNVANKYTSIIDNNLEFVPNNITEYSDGYYIVKYDFDINEENTSIYIGIGLDSSNNQYYIWYLE